LIMSQPIPVPKADECNCFALRQAARYVTQLYERHMAEVGLTAAQFTILAKVDRLPGLTMLDLADTMVMDRTTLLRALKPLQRDGLVVASAAPHDARALVFALSARGRATFERACIAWQAAQDEFEQGYGRERAAALRGELFSVRAG
jgi:DNA-binding MarR family transcriptional regulator